MKVYHVAGGKYTGLGAQGGAENVHNSLKKLGVDSFLLTSRSSPEKIIQYAPENSIFGRGLGTTSRLIELLRKRYYGVEREASYSFENIFNNNGLSSIDDSEKSIVHLHWPHRGIINFEKLNNLKSKLVWTLRDYWAFTGGCHYPLGCTEYIRECSDCHYIKIHDYKQPSKISLHNKRRIFDNLNINFIALSPWEEALAKKSTILKNQQITMIPNSVGIEHFVPVDKGQARSILGLNDKKKIWCIGAHNLSSQYKGPSLLNNLIKSLGKDELIITFGEGSENVQQSEYIKHFGLVMDKNVLNLIYSASDVFVCTSLEEVFGKTIVESLACGTPVVVYKEGGIASFSSGEPFIGIAKAYTTDSFLEQIRILANPENKRAVLSSDMVNWISMFKSSSVAEKHLSLYKKILQN